MKARRIFVVTRTVFLLLRSTTTPAMSPRRTPGMIVDSIATLRWMLDWLTCSTTMIMPNQIACCAVWVMNWAPQRTMKWRFWKMVRGSASVATLLTRRAFDGGGLAARDKGLHATFELAAREQDPALTRQTAEADVRAESDDAPLAAPARVRLP